MLRRLTILACTLTIGGFGLLSAQVAQAKDPEIKDGIAGTVTKVDVTNGTVTIADSQSRERTYSITEETVIVGPRGGVVRRRLKDPRFHSGLPITVVADGKTAAELHLGYDRKARERSAATTAPTTRTRVPSAPRSTTDTDSNTTTPQSTPTPAPSTTRTSRFRGPQEGRRPAKEASEEEDDDNEYPGKIKSVDPAKHMLVITLVNGKDRSFLVASDVKLMVNGRESRHGLSDASLKPGSPLTVVTEAGGRKVKEVKVNTSLLRRMRKAS